MSEHNTPDAPVDTKPAKEPKVATACACSEFSYTSEDGARVDTGCTAQTVNKFGPGHDAKLKSLLIKAAVEGREVKKTGLDGSFEEMTAFDAAGLHGFDEQVRKSADARIAKRDASNAKKTEADVKRADREAAKEQDRKDRAEKAEQRKADREAAKEAADQRKAEAKALKDAQRKADQEAAAQEREAQHGVAPHEGEGAEAMEGRNTPDAQ